MMDRNKEPESPVNVEKAMEHALFAVRNNWVNDVYGFEGWSSAEPEKKPLVIHDLNGQVLFYEFEVTQGDMPVGSVKASASKIIGSPVPQIQLVPRRWDSNYAINKAKEEARKKYPKAEIAEAELVCYNYPKIGVRIDIDDPRTGTESMIFDVSDLSLVDKFGSDELEGFTSYSFYNEVAMPEAARKERLWKIADGELEAAKSDIPRMFEKGLDASDQKEIRRAYKCDSASNLEQPIGPIIEFVSQKVIQYCPHCKTHDCLALHSQQTNVYCAVATGQMILDFYRYYYNQEQIAAAMGTGAGGTSNNGQVNGYKNLSNLCLNAVIDVTANWAEAKSEIDANRPLKSGIPGHARACFGWKRQNVFVIGRQPGKWLYILDPWPWNADICKGGAIYWEDWYAINHTNFIYVRHRTTPCK
ncbi:MAG: hypothetical protein JW999_06355 [Methanotrichaceae archaeon]|nr:hypothetical protein [Methanotrichaceae archaeon]